MFAFITSIYFKVAINRTRMLLCNAVLMYQTRSPLRITSSCISKTRVLLVVPSAQPRELPHNGLQNTTCSKQ